MTRTPETCPLSGRVERIERRSRRRERLAEVMFDSDLVATRSTLALAELLWGITLLWPGDTFGRPTYTLMASVASEEVWGLVFLLTAWVQWSLVVIGDFRCLPARIFAAWNAMLWVGTTTTMYLSVFPPPAAISGEAALALAATWIFVRPFLQSEGSS